MGIKKIKRETKPVIKFIRKNWALILAIVYFFFPLDIIPDVLPAFGYGDDLLVLLATLFIKYRGLKKQSKEEIIEGEIVDD